MATVQDTLRLTAAEFWRLLARTGTTLAGIWPQAVGLLLLGWSATQLAVLLGTEAAVGQPWAVIPILALGAVLQLVTILALLRFAAAELGSDRTSAGEHSEPGDARTDSFVRLVSMTLLTFMVLYAGFGFLEDYARQVVILSAYRKGYGDLLGALNPLETPATAVAMSVTVALGWLAGRLIEPWSERTRYPVPVRLLGVAVEAIVALTVLLGLFRLAEWARLWISDRLVVSWWDHAWDGIRDAVHLDLPAVVGQLWAGFADVVWPVLSTGVLRPLVWLAMAGLVFGARVLSLSELWQLDASVAAERRAGLMGRLRADDDAAVGVRAIVLRVQSFLFGGLDERVLPAWQSFRLVLRGGWPFLGAYLVAFSVVDLAGAWFVHLVMWFIGGHDASFWIRMSPFVDLAEAVVVTGFQWVLLAVAYQRAAGLGETPSKRPAATTSGSGPVRAATVTVVSLSLVVAAGLARPGDVEDLRRVALDEVVELQGQRVIVGEPRLAPLVRVNGRATRTDRIFLVVVFALGSPGTPSALGVDVSLRSGDRTYAPFDQISHLTAAPPGFALVRDLIFEVDPADITPDAVLRVTPVELVNGIQQQAEVALGLSEASVAQSLPVAEATTTPSKTAL